MGETDAEATDEPSASEGYEIEYVSKSGNTRELNEG